MQQPKIKSVFFKQIYNGGVEVRAILEDGETIILNAPEMQEFLASTLNTQTYTLERKERQQYRRLTLLNN